MDSLAFGKITNSKEGHIIETISNDKISIVFNSCSIEGIGDKIRSFHIKCIKTLKDKLMIDTNDVLQGYFESALINIVDFIFIHSIGGKLTIGIDAKLMLESTYIRYTVIAPCYPEKFYLIEKVL